MDVDETKRLILRRLEELRAESREPAPNHSAELEPAPPVRPVERRPRSRGSGWFSGRPRDRRPLAGDLEARLGLLEDRLNAVERCFVTREMAERRSAGNGGGAHPRSGREPEAMPPPPVPLHPAETPAGTNASSAATSAPEADAGAYQLNGSVEDGLMTDVLQLIASNNKTGRFSLRLDSRDARFDIYYSEGSIVHAQAGDLSGEAAFFALMTTGHKEGRYGFIEGEQTIAENTIDSQTHFLILEALRRIDEGEGGDSGGDG